MRRLPRLVPDQPFPPYAYRPGHNPHPTRDPDGHSYGVTPVAFVQPDPADWGACRQYLFGIDLFNHGYYWEAHEAWEGLWVACGRQGRSATFFRALINLAAAGFKARMGNARGVRANSGTALALFQSFAKQADHRGTRFMGLELAELIDFAESISHQHPAGGTAPDGICRLDFDLVLRPE